MITKKKYTANERTGNQFISMELKKKGYNVDRIVVNDGTESNETIAFGYYPSTTNVVKEAKEINARFAKEEKYEFIYWN